jgi:hypothetical protein
MAYVNGNKPIITNGLVYALDFGNLKSYTSGANTARSLVYDTAVTAVTGSSGLPTLVNGVLNITSSQFIRRTGSLDSIDPNGAFTISLVAKPNTVGSLLTQNLTGKVFQIQSTPSSSNIGFNLGTGTYSRTIPGFNSSSLQHISFRYNSGSIDTFLNGIPVTSSIANSSILPTGQLNALFFGSGSNSFSGSLANLYVYNRALSANEIYENYLVMAGRYGLPVVSKPYSIDENLYQWIQATNTTDTNIISAISTFISGLKSTGLWNKIQTIYPFVGTTTGSQTINLKEPGLYRLGLTGSFSASSAGLYPSSSTAFVDSIPGNTVHPLVNSQSAHLSLLSYDLPQTSSYPAAIVGGVGATGGEISYANGRVIHTFRSGSGSFTPIHPSITAVQVLVAAGGGGGGRAEGSNYAGGGGGAGGLIYSSSYTVVPSTSYTAVVGQGGASGSANSTSGSNGENSQFDSIVTLGGGGGGAGGLTIPGNNGNIGGSGGGAGSGPSIPHLGGSGSIGQGNNGGNVTITAAGNGSAGGGGAGGNAPDRSTYGSFSPGGVGLVYSISGQPVTYSEGGLGGGYTENYGFDGTPNTGNGGSGTRAGTAGRGGSGVVIVSYPAIPGNGPNNGFFITETSITGSSNSEFSGGITGSGNIGFLTVSRTGSNSFVLAKNTTQTVVNIAASGSMNPDFYFGAANFAGATASIGNANIGIAYASIGAGLTTSEVATYYNLVSQLQTNLKRQNTLLDTYSGAAAAYSLRRIGPSGYFGPAIRVRRDSDNTLRDIGFTSDGQLDTVGLLDFVGVTGSGFVNTWYDQSGNGYDAIQTTTTAQPIVVTSGSVEKSENKNTIRTTVDRYIETSNLPAFDYYSFYSLVAPITNEGPGNASYIGIGLGSSYKLFFGYGPTSPQTTFFNKGGSNQNTGINMVNNVRKLISADANFDNVLFLLDGVLNNTQNITGTTAGGTAIKIGRGYSNQPKPSLHQEIILYTSSRRDISSDVNSNILSVYTTGSDPDYQAFITATGITEPTQSAALETLVSDLKSYGLWSKMKAIYPMVTDKNNRFAQSEDFSQTWNAVSSSVTVNQITAPNGTSTADLIREEAGTGDHYVYQTVDTLVSGNEYVLSVYGRFLNRPWIALQSNDGAQAWFNLQTGVTGSFTGSSVSITNVGSGWYRCALFYTASSAGAKNQHIHLADANGNYNYAGVSGSGSYLWGAQFENGNLLGPYRATTATGFTTGSMLDQMKFNLRNPADTDAAFRLTYSGSWNGSYSGLKSSGITGTYMSTKLSPLTTLSQNSTHLSFYSRTSAGIDAYDIGTAGSSYLGMIARTTGNLFRNMINTNDYPDPPNTNGSGYFIGSRTAANVQTGFRNTVKISDLTVSSTTPATSPIYIGTINFSPAVASTTREYTFTTIGDGLTDYQAKALYWIVQKFQTTLGRQVY